MRVNIKERLETIPVQTSISDDLTKLKIMEVPVHIYNFVDDVDFSDEYELMEIVSDLRELLREVGDIVRIRVLMSLSEGRPVSHAEVTFVDAASANRAITIVEGLMCGGQTLRAGLALASSFQSAASLAVGDVSVCGSEELAVVPSIALYLYNMVSSDIIGDDDELQEVLSDVRELCAVFGMVRSVWIEHRTSVVRPSMVPMIIPTTQQSNLPWGVIQYSNAMDCINGHNQIGKHVVSGLNLLPFLYDYSAYENNVFGVEYLVPLSDDSDSSFGDLRYALRLLEFAFVEDIESDEEKEEMLENIYALLGDDAEGCTILFVTASNKSIDVFIAHTSVIFCLRQQSVLHHRVLGGHPLCIDVLQVLFENAPISGTEVYRYRTVGGTEVVQSDGSSLASFRSVCSVDGTAILVVQNFFSEEDLEAENVGDVVEMKRDLLRLALGPTDPPEEHPGLGRNHLEFGYVAQVRVVRRCSTEQERSQALVNMSSGRYLAGVEFASASPAIPGTATAMAMVAAEDAMLQLGDRVVGGVELSAVVERHYLARDSSGVTVVAELPSMTEPEKQDMDVSVVTTESNDPSCCPEIFCIYMEEYEPRSELIEQSKVCPEKLLTSGSKYVEAMALPRLPGHSLPRLAIPVRPSLLVSFAIRCVPFLRALVKSVLSDRYHFSLQVADEVTNAAAKDLLKLISTFQARLKEKNPLKSKQKLRFVTGLKQVRSHTCSIYVKYKLLHCLIATRIQFLLALLFTVYQCSESWKGEIAAAGSEHRGE